MATWPSANKPATTTTDADSDSISGARADINKALTNQNEIIDMFEIPGSPNNGYILKYNGDNNRFEMYDEAGGLITGITNFADNRVVTASGATTVNGEANLTFDGSTLTVTGALAVDNLKLDGNTLSSTDTNGNITLDPAGNGSVIIGPMSGTGGIQLNDNISNGPEVGET